MGTFVGFYKRIDLPKVTKDSSHLYNNKIMYSTHPKVIPRGFTEKLTNKQTN